MSRPAVKTDAVEHFQRGRMIGPGPRHLLEQVMIAQLLDQAHRDAGLRQREREAQPHRAGAVDNHAITIRCHARKAVPKTPRGRANPSTPRRRP